MTGVIFTLVMKANGHAHTKPEQHGTTVLVADGLAEGLVHAERPSFRARLTARWHHRRLDRALAGGVPPEASTALALRAQELTELERRQSIAGAIRQVIREAREGAPIAPGRIRPDRKTGGRRQRGAERARRHAGRARAGGGQRRGSGVDPAHRRDRAVCTTPTAARAFARAPPAPSGNCGPGPCDRAGPPSLKTATAAIRRPSRSVVRRAGLRCGPPRRPPRPPCARTRWASRHGRPSSRSRG